MNNKVGEFERPVRPRETRPSSVAKSTIGNGDVISKSRVSHFSSGSGREAGDGVELKY